MNDIPQSDLTPKPDRDRLIESIYRIALDPQSYDTFMDQWDDHVAATVQARLTGQAVSEAYASPDLETHFTIATRLLDETMPPPQPMSEDTVAQGDNRAAPRFLIDGSRKIVWHNAAAERLIGFKRGDTIDRLGLTPDRAAALGAMADALNHDTETRTLPLVFTASPAGEERILHFQARVLKEEGAEEVILASQVSTSWTVGTTMLLRDDFGLTPSEIDICEWIADGRSATQIAELRGASVATVRTQIKKIMAKTKTNAQHELVRLLHLLIRLAEDQPASTSDFQQSGTVLKRINVARNRIMPVECFGPEDGHPVIFLHGMLDGNAITRRTGDVLRDLNLRMICPVRPGFGAAAPDHIPIDEAPQRLAEDMQTLIEEMKLRRPVLLGHMAGAVYAFASAGLAPPGQVAGIVIAAGGVPILGPSQFTAMSPRQRVVAYTARYTPRILPFVLRAGIRQMRTGGERRFLLSLYENSAHDLPLVNDPEIREIVLSGYRFTVAQGHRAFEVDSAHVVSDWSKIADSAQVPVHLFHGVTDPVVSIDSVRDFAHRRANRVTLTELEETGQLAFYKSPEIILRAARDLADQPQL